MAKNLFLIEHHATYNANFSDVAFGTNSTQISALFVSVEFYEGIGTYTTIVNVECKKKNLVPHISHLFQNPKNVTHFRASQVVSLHSFSRKGIQNPNEKVFVFEKFLPAEPLIGRMESGI
jgi:hypothetical protein